MVATITAASVGDTFSIPYVSPRKYKNGSKKASKRKNLKSFFCILSALPSSFAAKYMNITEIIRRNKIIVRGLKDSKAYL